MRLIDADKAYEYVTNQMGGVDCIVLLDEEIAPTIKTKQIKYYDEDEKVWKTGEVIVNNSEKPNNCETCKWWEEDTNFCYSKADSDDHACHYERSSE